MYKYNIHPLNWYRTAFDSFFSSAKVQYFVLPMVQVGSYWVFLSYCGIILQSLANWTGHSLANWTGQSVAYWIGHSVAYWIEQSVRNWIEHSVDNRIGLWVSEILHDGSHLFRSQVDLMPVWIIGDMNHRGQVWSEPTKLDTTLTVHMRRRTLEEKLEAIRLVEAGNSPRSVSDRLHIGHRDGCPLL